MRLRFGFERTSTFVITTDTVIYVCNYFLNIYIYIYIYIYMILY